MSIRVIAPLDNVEPAPEERYLAYLDELRLSGVTNMFGAARYLRDEFPELDFLESRAVLGYWMNHFSERRA